MLGRTVRPSWAEMLINDTHPEAKGGTVAGGRCMRHYWSGPPGLVAYFRVGAFLSSWLKP